MSLNKDVSVKQERDLANFLDGNVVSGSGCGEFNCGDIELRDWLIECKTVTKPQTSFSVKKQWLDKIAEQSYEIGKSLSALAFRFDPDGEDYVVIDRETFRMLARNFEEQNT